MTCPVSNYSIRFPQKGDSCPDANPFNPVNPEAEDEAWNGDPYPMNQ